MAEIQTSTWSEAASSNNASPPDGFPEGQTAASLNNCARELMAAVKREWNRSHYTIDAGGTADAITLAYTTAPPAYVKGMRFQFGYIGPNTTGSVTVDVNGLGAKNLVMATTAGIPPGILANGVIEIVYDGTEFRLCAPLTGGTNTTTAGVCYYPDGTAEEWGQSSTVSGVRTISFSAVFAAISNVQITPSGASGALTVSPLASGTLSTTFMMVYGSASESFGFHWRVRGQY